MSKIKSLLAFAALMLCGGAWAAVKPVAVWDGNFKTTKCGVVTMDVLGNTVADDGSTITIKDGATQGVKFSWTTGRDGYTIIAKVRTLKTSSSRQVLVNGGANGNRTGVTWETDGTTKGIWNNTSWDNNVSYVQKKGNLSAVEDSDTFYIAGRHKSSDGGVCGTYLFANTGSGWESVYEASGCRADGDKTVYTAVSLGGPITANANTFVAAAGMVIEKVAIFHAHLTQDEIAAYQFPAPIDYSRWSENIAVMTWQGTNGNSFHPGPWSQFDIATKTDSTTTWGGTSVVSGVPGQNSNVTPWTIFCSSVVAATANHYIAPGYVLRLAADKGAVGTLNATFSTLALGGLIVEDCATGYSFDSGNDDRDTSLGNRDASLNVETWFEIRENFKIARKGALVLFGTLNFDIADGCTFDLNSTKSAQQLKFDASKAGVLKMHGKGTLKVATLTASGNVTLDFSDLAADRATSYIQGSLTIDDSTKFKFPADLAENVEYTLCTETLSAPQVPVHTTAVIGTETKNVVLTYNATNKSVSYADDTAVFWVPNTANASAFDNGNLIWDAEDAWLEGTTAKSWSQATAKTNVRIDAATVGGVKIVGQIAANEVIVECSDKATHAFEFHNHTLGVEKDSETDKDPTTDATWDCLTASAINLADYKGDLGLKVPIVGPINFSAGTHLVFRTGTAGGEASHAYAYNISGNTGAIEVAGDGKFQVPTTMYGIPFAPNATATIVYDNAETSITGALSGTGSIELQNGKTLALDPRWNQELHYVSAGTTANTLSWVGDGDKVLSSNDSKENPFVTVESGATLNIYGHDYAGWSGSIGDHSWFVNNGTIVFQRDGNNSRFWRDHIVLGNGSKVKIDTSSRHIALYGGAGTADKCQIMLESGTATIEAGVTNQGQTRQSLYFGNDGSGTYGTRGAGISVGDGATLTVSVPVAGGDTLTKWGAGTLVLSDVSSYTGTITLDGGMLTVPNTFDSSKISGVTAKIIGETTTYYKTLAHAIAAAGNENLDAITDIAADAVVPTGYRVKGGKVMTAADYYARWSNTENAAAIIDLKTTASFHDANFAVFYPATDTESSIFNGNQAATPPFGGLGNLNKPWNIFASKINGGNNSAYIAPGVALRFTGDVTGALMDATFAPLSFAGLIVEPGATGFGYKSWRTDSNRGTELGASNATTHSFIGEDFSIYRAKQGLTIKGTHVLEIASGKTLHVNDTTVDNHDYTEAGYKSVVESGATLKLVGAGKLSVGTLDASDATIDVSAIGSATTAFITGNVAVNASTLVYFPANWAAGTAMKLCSGTISGVTTSNAVAIRVGDEIKFATLTYADGAVSYTESTDPSVWVVPAQGGTKEISGDTTLSTVILNGAGKIAGSGVVTLGDVTCAEGATLTIGKGVTLSMNPISIPDYLVLEAGAKISGTAVPNLEGQTIKIADAANLQPGAYPVLEWTAGMGLSHNGYGVPSLDLQGVENDRVRLVCLVGKVYLQVLDPQLSTKKQYRIWAVGDSITEGYNGTGNGANYRTQLAAKLSLAGYNVKMVGQNTLRSQMPSGEAAPDEWAWHSGVSAQRIWTQNAFGSDNGRAGYMEAIDAAMFQAGEVDVITLLLGTNDLNANSGGGNDTAEHAFEGWKKLVKKLLAHYPNAKIIVSPVIDMHSVPEKVADYRQYLETSLTDGTFGDDAGRIYNAKLYDYVIGDTTNGMFEDGFHPTWNGHDKMSDGWYKAITNAIDKVAAAETPVEPVMPQLGAANNIPSKYTKLFKRNRTLDIGKKVSYALNEAPTYGNVSEDSTANVTKIGYYLELVRKTTKDIRYVWVDMNIPQGKTFEQMLVPTGATLAQKVTGLHVYSNMGSIAEVDPNDNSVEGYIEFTPFTATSGSVSGAPAQLWGCMDWNDTLPSSGNVGGRGSMQIHRIHQKGTTSWNSAETLFAWNNWGEANAEGATHADARNGEIGIGNFAQHYMTDTTTADKLCPAIGAQINAKFGAGTVGLNGNSISSDYTSTRFSPWGDTMNAEAYEVRNLEIWTYDPTALPEALLNGNATTFVEAVAAAQAGDTIDVLKNVAATNVALDKDITIGTVGGIDVSVAVNFTGAHKLTKVGVGTLTLTGSNQFNAIDIQEGAVELASASALATPTLSSTKNGRLIVNGFLPTNVNHASVASLRQPAWKGTFEIKNYSRPTNDNSGIVYFQQYGNLDSVVALNGVTTTMFGSKDDGTMVNGHYDQVLGTLEIMSGGWTSTALDLSNSPAYTCKLIGNGPITVHQKKSGVVNFIGDQSEFTGSVVMGDNTGHMVAFLPVGANKLHSGNTTITDKKILVAENAVVGGSGAWTASAGIVVNGELTFVSQPTITGTITGSGRLGFAKFSHVPADVKTNLQSTTGWTGTLVINGGTTHDGTVDGNAYTKFNEFGNVNSKIELADTMTGYFGLTTKNAGDDPATRIIKPEIVVSGTWSQDSGYSQRDNSKNYCTIIRKLSGSGHINGAGGASQLYYIIDGSEFTGKLTAKAPKFVFGQRVDNSFITDGSVSVFNTGIISSQMTIDSNNAVALNGVVSLPEGATLTDGATIYSYKGTLNVGETARAAVAGVVDSRFTVKGANDNHDAVLEAVAEDAPIVVPVVPDAGVIVEPGANVTVPAGTAEAKISVKYTDANGTTTDLKTRGYVTVAVADNGAVTVAPTEAAKPEAVKIKMTLPKEGEGVDAKDKVSFTITDPIPGLFYSIVSADDPTEFDKQSGAVEDSTGTQATGSESTTTSIDMPNAKVKYFRVRVKATK